MGRVETFSQKTSQKIFQTSASQASLVMYFLISRPSIVYVSYLNDNYFT